MIGIDTNVLVRYITEDDAIQTETAIRFIDSRSVQNPGYVPIICIAELGWVLSRTYKFDRKEMERVYFWLIRTDELVLEQEQLVGDAFLLFESSKADFNDCLIRLCSRQAGCDSIMTFDKLAAQAAGMTLLI